jgi:hypothetical protein
MSGPVGIDYCKVAGKQNSASGVDLMMRLVKANPFSLTKANR